MPRNYLIVQNDVRTGPFTLEELLQQPPLQSHAKVWVIGQSEDWRSPLEVPGLQAYFQQLDDGTIAVHDIVKEVVLAGLQPAGEWYDNLQEDPVAGTATVHSDLEEKPTIEPQSVVVPGTTQQESAPPLADKADLEELIEDESSGTFAWKNWAGISLGLLLVGFITWDSFFNDTTRIKRNREAAAAAAAQETTRAAIHTTTTTIEAAPLTAATTSEEAVDVTPALETDGSIVVPGYAAQLEEPASTDAFLDSVQRVLDNQAQLMSEVDARYQKSFNYKRRYDYKRSVAKGSSRSPYQQPSAASNGTAKKPLSQQVDLQSRLVLDKKRQQVNSVELMVRNNSKEVLKTVSVDVYYYKKGEKLLNKETVYFSNLYPQQSLTKSIAGNQRATTARFELGTITTGSN